MGIATQGQSPSATKQEAPGLAPQGQSPSTQSNFSQTLEQQISQAIQPVLDEFRQQMAQTMVQQKEAMPATGTGGPAPQEAQAAPPAPQPPPQPQAQPPQPQPQPEGQPRPAALPEGVGKLQQGTQHLLTDALRPAIRLAEQQGEQWIESLLIAGLAALLAEPTRVAIQQRAEQGLHTLLQKAFEPLPHSASSQNLQAQTERTFQAILQAALAAVFAEAMQPQVQQQGQQAIRESLHGDFSAALKTVEDTVKAILEAIATALRQQWQLVLRLVLIAILVALESSLEKSLAH